MDKLLRDTNNALWINPEGKYIRQRPFSEVLLTNGLIGDFSIENTTKVNGYITEWLDRNGTSNKLVQPNASYQLYNYGTYSYKPSGVSAYYSSGFTLGNKLYTYIFTVAQSSRASSFLSASGHNARFYLNNGTVSTINISGYNFKIDGINTNTYNINKFHVVSFNFTNNVYNAVLNRVFGDEAYGGTDYVKGLAIYNRILTPVETVYNHNALMLRYNIV